VQTCVFVFVEDVTVYINMQQVGSQKLWRGDKRSQLFTFMLPCIVIDFFLNNQPDAIIIQIYSVIKLYTFRASPLPIIRSSLLYIRHW